MPVHLLVRLAEDIGLGVEAVELQECLCRAEEAEVLVFPEVAEPRVMHETLPEQGVERALLWCAGLRQEDLLFDGLFGRQHEWGMTASFRQAFLEQDSHALPPVVIAVRIAHAATMCDAAVAALLDARDGGVRIAEIQIALPVGFVDIFLGERLQIPADAVDRLTRRRIVDVYRLNRITLEIDERDVLEHRVEIAQVVVELDELLARIAPGDVLESRVDEEMMVHLADDAQADADVVPAVNVTERLR